MRFTLFTILTALEICALAQPEARHSDEHGARIPSDPVAEAEHRRRREDRTRLGHPDSPSLSFHVVGNRLGKGVRQSDGSVAWGVPNATSYLSRFEDGTVYCTLSLPSPTGDLSFPPGTHHISSQHRSRHPGPSARRHLGKLRLDFETVAGTGHIECIDRNPDTARAPLRLGTLRVIFGDLGLDAGTPTLRFEVR